MLLRMGGHDETLGAVPGRTDPESTVFPEKSPVLSPKVARTTASARIVDNHQETPPGR